MAKNLIFLVDDDPVFRKVTQKLLNLNDFPNVETFESGEACINQLQKRPSLIILDFRLEKLNGLDVLKSIKAHQPKAKVVLFSSLDHLCELAEKCRKAGALAFFHKDEEGTYKLISWMHENLKSGIFSFLN